MTKLKMNFFQRLLIIFLKLLIILLLHNSYDRTNPATMATAMS